jgi:hypothetical protein
MKKKTTSDVETNKKRFIRHTHNGCTMDKTKAKSSRKENKKRKAREIRGSVWC